MVAGRRQPFWRHRSGGGRGDCAAPGPGTRSWRVDNVREGICSGASGTDGCTSSDTYIHRPGTQGGQGGLGTQPKGGRRPVNADPLTYQHTEVRK